MSLFILAMGLYSINSLPVEQYPAMKNAAITVTTNYTGASPSTMAGFITTPIENAMAQAGGIDYMTSSSTVGTSQITANLLLNYDPYRALAEITNQVSTATKSLPASEQQPQISLSVGAQILPLYIGFYSDTWALNKMTDYISRIVQPQFQSVRGCSKLKFLEVKPMLCEYG